MFLRLCLSESVSCSTGFFIEKMGVFFPNYKKANELPTTIQVPIAYSRNARRLFPSFVFSTAGQENAV